MISAIIEILSENSPLCAVVGQNMRDTKPKFYWVVCPETEKQPYVILRRAGISPNNMKDRPGLVDSITFESYTYGNVVEKCEEIDEMIRLCLEQKNFTTDAGYEFQRIFLVDKSDGFDNEAGLPFIRTAYTAQVRRMVVT